MPLNMKIIHNFALTKSISRCDDHVRDQTTSYIKSFGTFGCVSNIKLWGVDSNMAVASAILDMTCYENPGGTQLFFFFFFGMCRAGSHK